MNAALLLDHHARMADSPDAIIRLRRFVLDLAVRGKLVEQDADDEPASELLNRIKAERAKSQRKPSSQQENSSVFPFDLPSGWCWSSIGEVCSKTGSGSTPRGGREVYKDSGIPFLRSQNVYDDGLRLDDVAYIDPETHGRMASTKVLSRDLLLNITGGSMGRCCRVPDDLDEANVSQHVAIVRLAVSGTENFLHLLVRSPYFQAFIFEEQTGAGRGGLPKNRMDNIAVALPPLAEQHRIVAKVDELMALCDQLEAARAEREAARDTFALSTLARLNTPDPETFAADARFTLANLAPLTTRADQIKQLRRTILNLAVRGMLVEQDAAQDLRPRLGDAAAALPATWSYLPLKRLLIEDTRNGYSRRPDDAPNGVPILRISAGTVRGDGLVAEEEHKLISGVDERARLQYGLRKGDLLACRFNGNKSFVGRMTLYDDYLGVGPIYPDKLIRVRCDRSIASPEFVRMASESDLVRNEIEGYCATTVGNWGISAGNLKEVRFPIPPIAEQHRIVAKVDSLMALCDQLEASLATGEQTRSRLLEAVLHEAFEPV